MERTPDLDQLVYTTKTRGLGNWIRRWGQQGHLWPFPVGTACCGMEYQATHSTRFILNKGGPLPHRRPPEKSDLMILVGTITQKFLPSILEVYHKMHPQKWVMAVGSCAATGGPYPTYSVLLDIHQYIAIDVYVPGCPPSPEGILQGIQMIQERIRQGICAAQGSPS